MKRQPACSFIIMAITNDQITLILSQAAGLINDYKLVLLLIAGIYLAFYILEKVISSFVGSEYKVGTIESNNDNDEDIPPENKEEFRRQHINDFK